MSNTIDVKVRTEPSGAYELSTSLSTQAKTADSASSDVRSAASTVNSELEGEAVSGAHTALTGHSLSMDGLSSDMTSLSSALSTFAATMASVKERLQSARANASAAGLEVSGDTIRMPAAAGGTSASSADSTYEARKKKFQEISETVSQIRGDEEDAHETLQSACHKIAPPPVIQLAAGYSASVSPWATKANRASQATDTIGTALRSRYGKYNHPSGTPTKPTLSDFKRSPKGAWKNAKAYKDALTKAENWTPKPGAEGSLGWKAAEKASKVVDKAAPALKWVGRGSTVASGAVSAWDKYQSDSEKHPNMGQGEKVARAGAKGAVSAASGAAGAKVGAEVGAVAGAMVGGPVGAVVGGVAGGVIGGLAGSKVGDAFGDWAANRVSQFKNLF